MIISFSNSCTIVLRGLLCYCVAVETAYMDWLSDRIRAGLGVDRAMSDTFLDASEHYSFH
jgi:hypothetical protein